MKPFIPELGQEYYYITSTGAVDHSVYSKHNFHLHRIQTGNCFPVTLKADAEYHRAMQTKAWQIRQHAFEPDWSIWDQIKVSAFYNHGTNKIGFVSHTSWQTTKTVFPSTKTAREAFDGVSNDDFLYLQSRGLI